MSGDMMSFPDNWWTFVQSYQIADKKEIYTNGSMLIPSFRVRQMVEHYFGGEVGKTSRYSELIGELLPELRKEGEAMKLTAEQVERAIHDCSTYASYDGLQSYASGINLQAIADELNAMLGIGECDVEELERWDGSDPHYRCKACGHENNEDYMPRFCPWCGRKVKQ